MDDQADITRCSCSRGRSAMSIIRADWGSGFSRNARKARLSLIPWHAIHKFEEFEHP
jgi:hypothetical protein